MGINTPRDALIVIWDLLEGDTFCIPNFAADSDSPAVYEVQGSPSRH